MKEAQPEQIFARCLLASILAAPAAAILAFILYAIICFFILSVTPLKRLDFAGGLIFFSIWIILSALAGIGWVYATPNKWSSWAILTTLFITTLPIVLTFALPDYEQIEERRRHACVTNLKTIYHAKQQWALSNTEGSNAQLKRSHLKPYFHENTFPRCPAGGRYSLHPLGALPTCSLQEKGHLIYP